jgi:hypothetical protein
MSDPENPLWALRGIRYFLLDLFIPNFMVQCGMLWIHVI